MKIAFLDDHLLFAESMAQAVLHKFPEATVSCFSSWSELEPALNAEGFDLVFLDMRLEDCLGAELVPRIREVYPTTRIAIVSAFASRDLLIKCLNLGICGYISKTSPIEVLINAIGELVRGGSFFDEGIELDPRGER